MRGGTEAHFNVQVGVVNKMAESRGVQFRARLQFHVPHALARSLQQTAGVLERCAVEKTDVDMAFEGIDVPERRILRACDWATIVHQFSNISTAAAHLLKPFLRNRPQLDRAVRQPSLHGRLPSHATRQPQEIVAADQPAEVERNTSGPMLAHIPVTS